MNEEFLELIKKCKFISKPNKWFVSGSECFLDVTSIYPKYEVDYKFNKLCGLFDGITMETYEGFLGDLPREDGEICPFDEFYIYDEFQNEISELTLNEYKLKYIKNE